MLRTARAVGYTLLPALLLPLLALSFPSPQAPPELPGTPVRVRRVIDGDTVEVFIAGRTERVRVLGVDTPEAAARDREAEPGAEEATRFTRAFLARCDRVHLEVAGDRRDDHGRTLGFLWCAGESDRQPGNLSAALLSRGLARAIRYYEYPGREDFLALESRARADGRGLWSRGAPEGAGKH